MPTTLPRAFVFKVLLGSCLTLAACKHVTSDPPVKPGPPIPAEPETNLENVDTECAGLIAALDTYGKCPNLEDADRQWVRDVIEAADASFAAGKKASPDEPAQKAMAMACHRAALSMQFATERCRAGKRPRTD
jgi:hypothetical protein